MTLTSGHSFLTVISGNASIVSGTGQSVSVTGGTDIVRDLTLIFPEGVPASVSACVAKCPDILTYDAYGYSLKDTTVSGVRTTTRNIYDGTSTNGYALVSDGSTTAKSARWISDYIPINGSTISGNYIASYMFYDIGKNFISGEVKSLSVFRNINVPSGACYVRIDCSNVIDSTTIMICNGTFTEAEMQNYSPYGTLATLSFSSAQTLRSAITKADELDTESGVITRKVYELTNQRGAIGDTIILTNAKSNVTDIICSDGLIADIGTISGTTLTLTKAISGASFVYERATEDTLESIAPIQNVMMPTEGGGTINTIQTQDTEIDNCLDVFYDNLPA